MPTPEATGIAVTCSFNGSTALGLLQNSSVSRTGTETEAKNELGVTKHFELINRVNNLSMTYIRYTGVGMPDVDDIVEIAGHKETVLNGAYKVVSTGEESTQDGYPSVPLSLRRYTDGDIPTATTTTTTTV